MRAADILAKAKAQRAAVDRITREVEELRLQADAAARNGDDDRAEALHAKADARTRLVPAKVHDLKELVEQYVETFPAERREAFLKEKATTAARLEKLAASYPEALRSALKRIKTILDEHELLRLGIEANEKNWSLDRWLKESRYWLNLEKDPELSANEAQLAAARDLLAGLS